MKTALTLGLLAAGFTVSAWAASRVSRSLTGETTEQQVKRQEKTIRRVITALGCGFTVMLVGAVYVQTATADAHQATNLALTAARENCLSQQRAQAANEQTLIADVRLATAQYQGAVDALLDLDERIQAPFPDSSTLPPEVQEFLAAIAVQAQLRNDADRARLDGLRDRWQQELKTRQASLDDARTRRIVTCPPAESGEVAPDSTIEGE